MFTGLIEETGVVAAVAADGGARRISVKAARVMDDLQVDHSVCIDGCCQTVVELGPGTFSVVAVEETLKKTTFAELTPGRVVNLERALRVGDRLGGHFVLGHVDCVGVVTATEARESSWIYWIEYPPEHAPLVIPVGSITVNGVSLTVAQLESNRFMVSIIPHTFQMTTFGRLKAGHRVNLEFDMIGKYILGSRGALSQAV